MPSTYSTNLAIELIGNNDQAGTWGNTTNTNLGTLIEQAISGYVTQAVSTGTDTTITIPNGATGVARNMYIELTGTGGASTNLIVPANKKLYFIYNNTSSGQVTVKVAGQTGVSVPNGKKMVLVSNGTDIVTAENYVASLSTDNLSLTGNLTLSGGTANGVLYLNGSKVATSGSALTFDGTNFGVGTTSPTKKIDARVNTAGEAALVLISNDNTAGTGGSPTVASLEFASSGVAKASIAAAVYGNDWLSFRTGSNTERMRLTTSTLYTDSSINVGIGTSSPAAKLEIRDTNATAIFSNSATRFGYVQWENTGGELRIGTDGVFGLRFDTNAQRRMTIDTSGNLGIGTSSPAAKLDVTGTFNGTQAVFGNTSGRGLLIGTALNGGTNEATIVLNARGAGAGRFLFQTDGTDRMVLDQYGNLGLGVTPSAWGSVKAFQVSSASFAGSTAATDIGANCYYDGSNFRYITTAPAARYQQNVGAASHYWYTAPSGTAGNAISFTQAMTLDASSNLMVGDTTANGRLTVKRSTDGTIGYFDGSTTQFRIDVASSTINLNAQNGNGVMAFQTNSTERARITSGGNLLVGTTGGSVSALTVATSDGSAPSNTTGNNALRLRSTASAAVGTGPSIFFEGQTGNSTPNYGFAAIKGFKGSSTLEDYSGGLAFYTQPAGGATIMDERARITPDGYAKFSNNGTYDSANGTYHEFYQTGTGPALFIRATNASYANNALGVSVDRNTTNNSFYAFSYYNSGAAAYKLLIADSGNVTNTNGTYGTISDAKMKTNIVDAGSQWDDIKAIRFRKFKMKDDPTGLMQLGVVAQELEQTSPGLVDEHADKDAEGNDLGTTTKSVKTSVLLMKAAVALQEAMTRIEQLEAKVAALESK